MAQLGTALALRGPGMGRATVRRMGGRWLVGGALLCVCVASTSPARAQSGASGLRPGPVRVRLAIGPNVHGEFGRRAGDGFARLQALGLDAPHIFGHAAAELDHRLGAHVRLGIAAGVSWRSAGREETVSVAAPRDIRSTWRYGYGEAYAVIGTGRLLGALWLDTGARIALGGGSTSWTIGEEAARAPIVRASAAFEIALLVRGRGVALTAGYALVRSGRMGPAELSFDYSHLFVTVGFVGAFG